MFSGSGMADDRQVGKKYRNKAAVAAIYVSGGTGGAVFVRKQGSITVEAACVMAVVLFSLAALIENAGRSMMRQYQLWYFMRQWKNAATKGK